MPADPLTGHSRSDGHAAPEWLAPLDQQWVRAHGPLLDVVFSRFHYGRAWPNVDGLQRELTVAGWDVRVDEVARTMPSAIGHLDHATRGISLTLLGIGCVPDGRPLLEAVVKVLGLALAQLDQPSGAHRLSRDDIATRLHLQDGEADRLSQVLLADCPFLVDDGDAGLRTWNLLVHERAVTFRGDDTPEKFLAHLADLRGVRGPRPSTT